MALSRDELYELEAMIDTHSLTAVVQGLFEICSEKAEHIRSNCSHPQIAKHWTSDARVLSRAIPRLNN